MDLNNRFLGYESDKSANKYYCNLLPRIESKRILFNYQCNFIREYNCKVMRLLTIHASSVPTQLDSIKEIASKPKQTSNSALLENIYFIQNKLIPIFKLQ